MLVVFFGTSKRNRLYRHVISLADCINIIELLEDFKAVNNSRMPEYLNAENLRALQQEHLNRQQNNVSVDSAATRRKEGGTETYPPNSSAPAPSSPVPSYSDLTIYRYSQEEVSSEYQNPFEEHEGYRQSIRIRSRNTKTTKHSDEQNAK